MFRVGFGYDSHRFDDSRSGVRIGGVEIQNCRALQGHSDADVLLHAITDALLGSIGSPDIGELFPTSDKRNKGKDSKEFVKEALSRVRKAGWSLSNIDSTLVCDEPVLSPYKERIRKEIAAMLGLSKDEVSVKAKTTEGLSPGDEGIESYAIVLIARTDKKNLALKSTLSTKHKRQVRKK
jgi:2-C-methyl-D-erythritol 2,4-cyclodiphosphate synthase